MTRNRPVAEMMLSSDEATVTPWDDTSRRLAEGGTHWLSTVRPDGTPHLVPVGGVWLDDALYFTTGQGTRKQRNLAHNAHCAVAIAGQDFHFLIEGTASEVRDEPTLVRLAEVYRSANGWPVTVQDGAFDAPFSAPTTGPPPYDVYRVTPTVVFALGTRAETVNGATRYRF